jgi:hypothetical protein
MNIFVRILSILLAIAFIVLAYYVVIYVLGLLGIRVPEQILTVIFVIIALMVSIGVLSGRFDNINWWGRTP